MQAALASSIGFGLTAGACHALGVSRASLYRGRARLMRPPASPPSTKPRSPRALSAEQRRAVLDRLREPRFVDLAPAESTPRCWMRAPISAQSVPCIAF